MQFQPTIHNHPALNTGIQSVSDEEQKKRFAAMFGAKQFDVEHALSMYACSFVVMPAFGIYDENILSLYAESIKDCHVYLVGTLPKVTCSDIKERDSEIVTEYVVLGNRYELRWPIPDGTKIEVGEEGNFYVVDQDGEKSAPDSPMIMRRLSSIIPDFGFKVLYIGQAYGEDGSRSALDRLRKHETLQKIAVQGIPADRALTIVMLQIMPDNRIMTMFNPFAKNKDEGEKRINMGLDVLFNTDEAQRTTLYEASLIRYFRPEFNTKFKDKFPSTNNKVLSQCYDKDFNALSAEICIDEMPFEFFSDTIERKHYHIAHHDLHKREDRKVFFAKLNVEGTDDTTG